MGKRVLVMAGGTGGHVFPALAIVRELEQRGHQVEWLGTKGRIEEQLIPKEGIKIHYIDVKGVRGNGLVTKLKAPFMIMHAIFQARQVLKDFVPDVVIGFGGYASGPGGVAAYLQGIPLALHEQNAAAGLTNRILSCFANKVLLGVGEAFNGEKVESVGNPVRANIMELAQQERSFEHQDGLRHILVVGGSLGAQALNEQVPLALKELSKNSALKFKVLHQCGKNNSAKTQELYQNATFEVVTSDFVTDMHSAYQEADIIICRAGASTVSEVSAVKLPAIFVPLPTAVDDHQTKNALTLVNAKAAKLLPQNELNAQSLSQALTEMFDSDTLKAMSIQSATLAKLDATKRVCDILEAMA